MVDAAAHDPARQARVDQAQRALSEVRRRLAQYRAALDSGADPGTVTEWIGWPHLQNFCLGVIPATSDYWAYAWLDK